VQPAAHGVPASARRSSSLPPRACARATKAPRA
jgi:hypothetical protein